MTTAIGPMACLAAAFAWALAVEWFRPAVARHGATAVNLAKNAIASVLLGLTLLVVGQLSVLMMAPTKALLLIALSGVIGMALGDSALFAAVHRLGAHRSLLLQTLAPAFAAGFALALTGERLGGRALAGALVIVAGVLVVLAPRASGDATSAAAAADPRAIRIGVAWAVVAAASQGGGVVLAKIGMDAVPVLAAAFVRLAVAAVALALLRIAARGRLRTMRPASSDDDAAASPPDERAATPSHLRGVVGPTLLGTYLAVLLMMLGIDRSPAAVAAVLLATTPVFSLLIDAVRLRRPIGARALIGTALTVVGVALLSVG
ncbi:MAG: EamA family transporter [Acidobacteriota bacterium]